ncbi:MAG: ATP-binding cassette domain-containing protein, partial [Peristeroidobacter soli]
MDASILTLSDIRKSFGGVRALERANLELARGSVTALIGENGAGKSTLVKILSGIHQPDGGEIRFDGNPARIADPQAARALGIGVVHQECLAFDNLSVAENLFVNCQPSRRGLVNWSAMRAQATAVL